jgi:pimeloyl-ACP methyl ester carboxylesterase
LYEGSDHPQVGYYCEGEIPDKEGSWRYSQAASEGIQGSAIDANGNIEINLITGVENFNNKVLFMVGECQKVIGADWQRDQMEFFPSAELVVIPDVGHEMFAENAEASITAVREYLNTPIGE